jgi:hypothetical protein
LLNSNYLFLTSAFLCLLYFIGFFKNGKTYKIFTIYIVCVLLIDYVGSNLYRWFKIYNVFISHFFDLFQFVLLSFFYSTLLNTKNQLKILYVTFIVLLSFLSIRYLVNPNLFFEFSLLESYLTTMPIIIYATMHLYNNLGKKAPFYYANLGLLFYLFSSTFLFLLYELVALLNAKEYYLIIVNINIVLQYIKFGFFFYQLKIIYFNSNDRN